MRKPYRFSCVALVLVGLCAWQAHATSEYERATLKGLPGVGLSFERPGEDAERDGLTRQLLGEDVYLQLHQAGIRVLDHFAVNGRPALYLNVNTLKTGTGLYVFSLSLDLKQTVKLSRASITAYSATWSATGRLGAIEATELRTLRETVRDMVDEFINAYLAVNPKESK